ncbi:MAG TPA: F0F1 ATP synthase subunit B [Candidatus Saccharimonadales bacterium]|nr:F0F1 ATP synthase subunit B [Candidatus Saccharimonadales bacterium]
MNHIVFASILSDAVQNAKDTAERFGLDWPHVFAQIISFCIVAACLYKFAYKPILDVLEERRQRIASGLANADKIKQELARTEALQREVLEKANVQATRLIEEARAAAARVQEQETQKAIAQAEQIISKAREATALERSKMLTDLRREVGSLVAQTTSLVIGKVLTPEDQQRLAEETRRQLAA